MMTDDKRTGAFLACEEGDEPHNEDSDCEGRRLSETPNLDVPAALKLRTLTGPTPL